VVQFPYTLELGKGLIKKLLPPVHARTPLLSEEDNKRASVPQLVFIDYKMMQQLLKFLFIMVICSTFHWWRIKACSITKVFHIHTLRSISGGAWH